MADGVWKGVYPKVALALNLNIYLFYIVQNTCENGIQDTKGSPTKHTHLVFYDFSSP